MSDNILLLAEDGSYLITESGDYIIAVVQYLTTALNGSYTVSGQTANILKSKTLSLSYGSYSLTGQSANLVKGLVLTADSGFYAITGQTARIDYFVGYTIVALNSDYSIVGNDATISYVSNAELQRYIELRSFTERRRM